MYLKPTLSFLLISISVFGQTDKYKQQSYDVASTTGWIKENSASGFSITSLFFQSYKFGVVMSTNSELGHQLQRFATNESIQDTIQKHINKGYSISTVTGGAGKWSIVFSSEGKKDQKFFLEDNFQAESIRNTMQQGLKLTSIARNDTKCFAVLSLSDDIEAQEIITNNILPRGDIKDLWDKGYSITDALYSKGAWTILMSKTKSIQTQIYQTDAEFPVKWIKQKWNEGYRITSVAKNGEWLVVMSKFR